ncbi:MAG: quinone-dependent dihydroorotate dehydrogenase [Myxococcaceae bacterium]|nr:quinone-dependent dihydroorotate dehydrogenase [Myxococcaceae bacterium]MCI0670658.1 quinone-dependent dihydroorotate dehydrogenase [Myxococcaceae bacterium]
MYPLIRSLLFLLPPEAAHVFTLWVLGLLSHLEGLCRWLRARTAPVELAVDVAGLRWPNPVGLAAGLDKDAHAVDGLFSLGFGAVEVGTLTPRPQPGNPKPRLFRLPEHRALINRLGFNNHGAAEAASRLSTRTWRPGPVGVNVGKNKDTPLADAVSDYVACVDQLAALGDYVVVNASSPNTPNLRQLQEPEALTALLTAVQARIRQVAPGKPLLLKIAPDLGPEAVDAVVDVALACGIQGLIATNTTITRPVEHPLAGEQGGFSGAPLRPLADAVLARAAQRAAGRLTLIGVGGVFTAEDAYRKIRAGASAVQLYTGFIYGGPASVKAIVTGLAALLERDGFRSVQEAVGADLVAMRR